MTCPPKTAAALATVLFALTACGGGSSDDSTPTASETAAAPVETVAPVEGDALTGEDTPTGEPTPTETPSPAPTPTAAATTAAATTPAAAAGAPMAEPASFAVCKACHSVEPGKNGIGPTLAGVWNARAGHIDSFDYSDQLEESGLVWNQANLDRYLLDPRGTIPGTKMAFAGVKDAAKRQEIIDYLKGL